MPVAITARRGVNPRTDGVSGPCAWDWTFPPPAGDEALLREADFD